MSAPPKFATLPEAIAAYRAGRSRRWAEVDGWQIDLEQAASEASRAREEPPPINPVIEATMRAIGKSDWDWRASAFTAAELARTSEVLPELAVPEVAPVERCPWCGHVEEVKP